MSAEESPWKINRTLTFNTLRRVVPKLPAGVARFSHRLARELLTEIARNLQKFVPSRADHDRKGPSLKRVMLTSLMYDNRLSHEN